jgi:CRISPR/Cas system endoribonuclease Cas6 (RAMP superfamily)
MKKIISIIFSCFICHVGYSENNLEDIIQLNEALYDALHEKDQRISGFFFSGKKEDTFHFTPVEKNLIINALKKQATMYMKKGKMIFSTPPKKKVMSIASSAQLVE